MPLRLFPFKQWDFQMNVEEQSGAGSWEIAPSMILFNIQETQYISTTYPGNSLLEIHGVASEQITGFDQMETSAITGGRLVEVPTNGIYNKVCTRNRAWIIRQLLIDDLVGLNLPATLIDNASFQAAADYYEELVPGFDPNVDEQRDYCDVIFTETRPGWDWINTGYVALVGQWTNITVVYDEGIISTYANGTLMHQYQGSGMLGDVHPGADDFRIGWRQLVWSSYFQGVIDDVKLFNRALSSSEVSGLYNAEINGQCSQTSAPTAVPKNPSLE